MADYEWETVGGAATSALLWRGRDEASRDTGRIAFGHLHHFTSVALSTCVL